MRIENGAIVHRPVLSVSRWRRPRTHRSVRAGLQASSPITQGAVLPGVTVTATSPSLIGVQTTVTQADGRYMFPAMPSGTYKLAFDLTGFQEGRARQHRRSSSARRCPSTRSCEVGGLTESVTVTGDSPLVDTSTTKIGTSLKGDELIAVPELHRRVGRAVGSRPACACRASTSAAATRASSPDTRCSASRARRAWSPTASTTPRASAAPGSTRTTTPTRKSRSARSAPTSR